MAHYVRKYSGEVEPFNSDKFKRSLFKAGATNDIIQKLIADISHAPGITSTRDIYEYAYSYLKTVSRPTASRYSLKNALYQLGPDGFAFEKFVAEIFRAQQYTVQLDQIIQGLCVKHEVDLVLERDNDHFTVECKFHNTPGIKSDVKIPLYIQARFDDISSAWNRTPHQTTFTHKQLLITNTQFTTDAIAYGECMRITMIGWAYPEKGNIADLIETLNLHPITSLTSLTNQQKHHLVAQDILLCRDLVSNNKIIAQEHLTSLQLLEAQDECRSLGSINK